MKTTVHVLISVILTTFLLVSSAYAVPVRPGQWTIATLATGETVRVQMRGDEFCHFWQAADGRAFQKDGNGCWHEVDAEELIERAMPQRAAAIARRSPSRVGQLRPLDGEKKCVVIMVQFADKEFAAEHTPEYYRKVFNEGGPAEKGYRGSVKKYFLDQSNGKLSVDFDVYGIVTLPHPYAYYGEDIESNGSDRRRSDMLISAVTTASSQFDIDWKQYDWNNDGEVEQVAVLYAGYGQASKVDDTDLIWPVEMEFNGIKVGTNIVKTIACSNEMAWNDGTGDTDIGIGTFCHEFAHCLGYPDTYDLDYECSFTYDDEGNLLNPNGLSTMDRWDLLDQGSYNDHGFCPTPLTSFEKFTAGWITPIELEDNADYDNMRPVTDSDGGTVYVITNPECQDEYYMFEYIKSAGWFEGLVKGLNGILITHVDYKPTAWLNNAVNCRRYPSINNHSRYTYIPADGSYWATKASHLRGDLFPYKKNNGEIVDSFCGKWYNGRKLNCAIKLSGITVNDDGTMSFHTGVSPKMIASQYRGDHADILSQSVDDATADMLDAVDKALADYDSLDDEVKTHLTEEKDALDALRAKISDIVTVVLPLTDAPAASQYYNLHGQRVDKHYRGVVVRNGVKVVNGK